MINQQLRFRKHIFITTIVQEHITQAMHNHCVDDALCPYQNKTVYQFKNKRVAGKKPRDGKRDYINMSQTEQNRCGYN